MFWVITILILYHMLFATADALTVNTKLKHHSNLLYIWGLSYTEGLTQNFDLKSLRSIYMLQFTILG